MAEEPAGGAGAGDPGAGGGAGGDGNKGGAAGAGNPAGQQTFSAEYVQSLREEAKSYRLQVKQFKTYLQNVLGLKDTDEITDATIANFKTATENALKGVQDKANARLIAAEIKALDGYDSKLFQKLLAASPEVSKLIKINDAGEVEGVKEAAEALVKEFPQVKKADTPPGAGAGAGGFNPPGGGAGGAKTLDERYKAAIEYAQKHPSDHSAMQTVFLLKEEMLKKK